MPKPPLFHTAHYNIIAAQFKSRFATQMDSHPYETQMEKQAHLGGRNVLVALALSMTKRFKEDNPIFDPLKFLDACSPDPDNYPLSELWEEGE